MTNRTINSLFFLLIMLFSSKSLTLSKSGKNLKLQTKTVSSTLVSNGSNGGSMSDSSLQDSSGTFTFWVQDDGNLVLYGCAGKYVMWESGTGGNTKTPQTLSMQGDGNLVLYDSTGKALWATGTNGKGGVAPFTLSLQGDGNLVLYDSTGKAYWASNTSGMGSCELCFRTGGDSNAGSGGNYLMEYYLANTYYYSCTIEDPSESDTEYCCTPTLNMSEVSSGNSDQYLRITSDTGDQLEVSSVTAFGEEKGNFWDTDPSPAEYSGDSSSNGCYKNFYLQVTSESSASLNCYQVWIDFSKSYKPPEVDSAYCSYIHCSESN